MNNNLNSDAHYSLLIFYMIAHHVQFNALHIARYSSSGGECGIFPLSILYCSHNFWSY